MQCAAGEIRGEEPGDAGLALKAEIFTNGCAAAERDSPQPRGFWVWFFFAGAFFLLPLPFFHNRFIFSEFKIYFH